jgi:hypothetical protein
MWAHPTGIKLAQERRTAILLFVFSDFASALTKRLEGQKEAMVALMAPAYVTGAMPTCTSQRIKAAVITDSGIGVSLGRVACEASKLGPGIEVTGIERRNSRDSLSPITLRLSERVGERCTPLVGSYGKDGLG